MKNVLSVLMGISIMLAASTFSSAREAAFTQEDRERLIRLETKIDEGLKALNQRIDTTNQRIDDGLRGTNQRIDDGLRGTSQRIDDGLRGTNQRIDDLRDLIYVVIGGMIALIGFVVWDRRSALAPAIRRTKELEEREELLEKALKEFGRIDPRFGEVLKSLKLM
jgi:hypothetical protein